MWPLHISQKLTKKIVKNNLKVSTSRHSLNFVVLVQCLLTTITCSAITCELHHLHQMCTLYDKYFTDLPSLTAHPLFWIFSNFFSNFPAFWVLCFFLPMYLHWGVNRAEKCSIVHWTLCTSEWSFTASTFGICTMGEGRWGKMIKGINFV